MQENNNFETIISTWRRLSGEQIETAVVSMSGDSSEHQPYKKKEEESDLLPKPPISTVTTVGTAGAATADAPTDSGESNPEEKKGFIQYDKEESKIRKPPNSFQLDLQNSFSGLENDCSVDDANIPLDLDKEPAGDSNEKAFKTDKDDDYLENDKQKSIKSDKDKIADNVDSVYLRPPPPHKTRSNTSNVEQEDCGITCLYYTLQCCDCVLM